MSQSPLHPKRAGSSVESVVIDAEPGLASVSDRDAEWHDARTDQQLTPAQDRPIDGWVAVPSDSPVETKGTIPEHANGGGHTTPGRWYLKRPAHEQLLRNGGVYYLTVYAPVPETPLLARKVVPATEFDDLLSSKWYKDRGRDVARVPWTAVFDTEITRRDL